MNCAEPGSPKRSPSAAARAANSDASARAAATRVSAVDINPQFVVLRTFQELDSTVRAIKAGPLPVRSTVYDSLGRSASSVPVHVAATPVKEKDGEPPASASAGRKEAASNGTHSTEDGAGKGSGQTTDGTSGTTNGHDEPHPVMRLGSISSNSVLTLSSPLVPDAPSPPATALCGQQPGTSLLFPSNSPPQQRRQQQPPSGSLSASPATSPNARHPSTSTGGGGGGGGGSGSGSGSSGTRARSSVSTAARKMLFIWDVDDTLVASGAAGVRQNAVFNSAQLLPLFKALPNARHLLLSQGSIDDVFYPGKGRLRYLEKFFAPNGGSSTNSGGGESAKAGDDASSLASRADSTTTNGEKKKKKSGSIFSCGGTKEKTHVTDEVTTFEKGTALIRLTTVRGVAESPDETNFMYDINAKPKLHGPQGKGPIRWLVLRPSTWGITLATLNSLFTPSTSTACVDGKVFHKMDVAWSLAKSGLWDSVFFIDNNLSEIGIVKYGMNINHVLELQQTHSIYKFFHAEFMLLAAAAKIRQLEKKLGRDVTVPPPGQKHKSSSGSTTTTTGAASKEDGETVGSPTLQMRAQTTDPLQENPTDTCGASLASSGVEEDSMRGDDSAGQNLCSPTDPTFGQGGHCRQVDLVVAHLHIGTEKYRQLLLGNRSGTDIGARNSDVTRSTGQPTFNGDVSLTDDQYEALLALFRMEESMMYQLMDEDIRTYGYVDVHGGNRYSPHPWFVHMPVYRRPTMIPHMRHFYRALCDEVETRVVNPLAKGGGLIRGASVIRGDAHILCTQLLRAGPFIDAQVQGQLALELFMVYAAEGNVEKASAEYVHKAVRKLLDDPKEEGKKKKK